jgi:hypothetical protein
LFFGLEIEVEGWDSKSDSAMHAYQLESMDLAPILTSTLRLLVVHLTNGLSSLTSIDETMYEIEKVMSCVMNGSVLLLRLCDSSSTS